MHYILDGYNVLHKLPIFSAALAKKLETARLELTRFCAGVLRSRGDIKKITIVFDGAANIFADSDVSGQLEIIYTVTGEDADDRILYLVRQMPGQRIAVVSDDNYVCNNAKALAARVVSVADFFALSRRTTIAKSSQRKPSGHSDDKKISAKDRDEITRAYAGYLGIDKK